MPGPATACMSRPSMRPHCSSITSPSIMLAALALASTAASAVAKSPHSATFVEIPNAAACTTHSQQPQLQSCQPGSATSSVCVGWQPLQSLHSSWTTSGGLMWAIIVPALGCLRLPRSRLQTSTRWHAAGSSSAATVSDAAPRRFQLDLSPSLPQHRVNRLLCTLRGSTQSADAFKSCSPARCSFQSGRLPVHVLDANTIPESFNPNNTVSGFAGIPRPMRTVAHYMKDAGYSTHFVGTFPDQGQGQGRRRRRRRVDRHASFSQEYAHQCALTTTMCAGCGCGLSR